MKLLHTSDWHVGKQIRGHSRADEHRAVLAEMAAVVADQQIDVVLVAGDLFETASPGPESEAIVYRALLDFVSAGATVAVISGNHDNPNRLRAVAPLLEQGNMHVLTEPRSPDDGGVRRIQTNAGETLQLAMIPFVSQRGIVRSDQLMADEAFQHAQAYTARMKRVIELMTSGFGTDTVNVLMAHAFVRGGETGGGERMAHLVEEYAVSSQDFPATAGYVALGHLHRPQKVAAATAVHYCGSPLQLDFGEARQTKQVNVVELTAGLPALVTPVELTEGVPLRTISGTLDELRDAQGTDAWLRVRVNEPRRAGLADDVRELLGDRVVDVLVEQSGAHTEARVRRQGRSPVELFAEFLAEQNVEDPEVEALFAELLTDYHQGELEDAS